MPTTKKKQQTLLDAASIINAGKEPTPLEVPTPDGSGTLGVVHLRALSAGAVMRMAQKAKASDEGGFELVQQAVVTEDGEFMFDDKSVREVPYRIFFALLTAVNEALGIEEEEAGGESRAAGAAGEGFGETDG